MVNKTYWVCTYACTYRHGAFCKRTFQEVSSL